MKKLKKLKYLKEAQLLKLIDLADNKDFLDDDKTPNRTDHLEKTGIDRSTFDSFDGPCQLIHADVENLEFLNMLHFLSMRFLLLTCIHQKHTFIQ